MSLRSHGRWPHHGLAWLALALSWAGPSPLAATSEETSARTPGSRPEAEDGKTPHAPSPAPGGAASAEPSPPGFEQWLQDLRRRAADPGPDRERKERVAVLWHDLHLSPEGPKVRTYLPGSRAKGAKVRYFGAPRGREKSMLETGLELRGSQSGKPLHPFFSVRGDERIGKVSRLHISSGPGRTEDPPRELGVELDHSLGWMCDSGGGYQSISPVGTHHSISQAHSRMRHSLYGAEWTWSLLKTQAMVFHVEDKGAYKLDLPEPLEKDSRRPVGSERGDQVFVPMRECLLHLHLDTGGPGQEPKAKAERLPRTPETRNARLVVNRAGNVLVQAPLDQPFLIAGRVGEEGARFATASGGTPVCLAQGAGAEVWFIQVRPFGIGCLDTETMSLVHLRPGGRWAEVQDPHEAALGPDGNLWFTDRKGCRIGRIVRISRREGAGAPVGEVALFDLGKGQHPEEIICSKSAWLYFTLKDQAVIGSIRALDARPEDACGSFVARQPREAAEGVPAPGGSAGVVEAAAGTATSARPRRKLSGAERRKRKEARASQEAFATPGPEDPDPAPGAGQEPPAARESKAEETQAPPPSAASAQGPAGRGEPAPVQGLRRSSLERLEAMYVRVEDDNLENHVLRRHAAESKAKASKFAPRYSDREGLLRLLADALDGAEIGRELRTDRSGNLYTPCRQAGVGRSNGEETDIFTVVTRIVWNKRTRSWWHELVTVFPGD